VGQCSPAKSEVELMIRFKSCSEQNNPDRRDASQEEKSFWWWLLPWSSPVFVATPMMMIEAIDRKTMLLTKAENRWWYSYVVRRRTVPTRDRRKNEAPFPKSDESRWELRGDGRLEENKEKCQMS